MKNETKKLLEGIDKIIKKYQYSTSRSQIKIKTNSIEKIINEILELIKQSQSVPEGYTITEHTLGVTKNIINNQEEYKLILNVIDNAFVTDTIEYEEILIEIPKKKFNINHVENTSLYHLLVNTTYEDQLTLFYNEMTKYQVDVILEKDWIYESRENYPYRDCEVEKFRGLFSNEQEAFAYGQGYAITRGFMDNSLYYLFDTYTLDFINTFFETIEFVD